jgi:hypothetical protein
MSTHESASALHLSRRNLMKAAAALLVNKYAAAHRPLWARAQAPYTGRKVIVVACGGIRRAETFSQSGVKNIPHLYRDLLPHSVFYPSVRNAGVTSHFNTTSSILTGQWQRVDDWGKTPPASPTLFEHLRKQQQLPREQTWLISSNKALTSKIGASSVPGFGPAYGANVVFPKQMLINAVVHAAGEGRAVHSTERSAVLPEIEAMLNRDNFDGLGWSVASDASTLDPLTLGAIEQAIQNLVHTNAPVTGDEFTYLVSVEIMRRFAPALMVLSFSDMEVAHFGSYAMHLGGIRTVDRLVFELWNQVQSMPAYKDNTTLFVLPEFGRDADGSNTNGFFNHRQDADSTRLTWMICLGDAARKPQVVEDPCAHISLFPSIARILALRGEEFNAAPLAGLAL